jgi:hypothetical protein
MIQVIRHCPDCGWDRLFEQYHMAGSCPDAPDGDCSEWSCTGCGAALLIGFPSNLHDAAEALELRDMVA